MVGENKKVVLITGCSSGFGLLTAARLSIRNYIVYATMRNLAKKDDLIDEVAKRGGQVNILQLDVTDKESIRIAVDKIIKDCGRIDVVVNNAGYGIGGFFEDLSEDDIRKQMETNFFGVQNATRAVLPLMRKKKRGVIINVSSVAGLYASPCFGAYNASKWALEAFSESLWYEVRPFGIKVALVEPGLYRTKIFEENGRSARDFNNPKSPYFNLSQHLYKKIQEHVKTCKRDPEDVAKVIEKLIESKNPPLRNFTSSSGKIFNVSRRLLPFSMFSQKIKESLFGDFKGKDGWEGP